MLNQNSILLNVKNFLDFVVKNELSTSIFLKASDIFSQFLNMAWRLVRWCLMFFGVYLACGTACAESRGDGLGLMFLNHTYTQFENSGPFFDAVVDGAYWYFIVALFVSIVSWIAMISYGYYFFQKNYE